MMCSFQIKIKISVIIINSNDLHKS